jgi:DNA-binding response OmpR family regulator
LDSRRSVLIVDASDETRVVLQTALERRGLRTITAREARQGLAMARECHPDLIVLDLEIDPCGLEEIEAPFAEQSRLDQGSLVLLGSARRRQSTSFDDQVEGAYVAKPYHYGPLIRRIEEILSANSEKTGTIGS